MKKSTDPGPGRHRSYGHHCATARALDVVGDRWNLLIVRELLLLGEARFTELRAGLPGIASNLLTDRLRLLQADGVVESAGGAATTGYRLTARGRDLAPVIRELTRWGLPLMAADDHEGDAWRGRWAALALDALFADVDTSAVPPFTAVLSTDDDEVVVVVAPGEPVRVAASRAEEADHEVAVRVHGTVGDLQQLLGGDPTAVRITGDPGPLLALLASADAARSLSGRNR